MKYRTIPATRIRILAMTLVMLVSGMASAQTRHALVIGIGQYPENSGWNEINGDKDIPVVTDMLRRCGFKDIVTLENSEATFDNILMQLNRLASVSDKGDRVYIHFSGHGQQITDLDGDEEDGYDEALIPYDAGKYYIRGKYAGERHLTDDIVNEWLVRIRKNTGPEGKIVFIADACHSGDITRAEDDSTLIARGTADKFEIPVTHSGTTVQRKVNWISLSACRPYQTNYEYRTPDGQYHGKLSWLLAEALGTLKSPDINDIFSYVRKRMAEISRYPQNPVLDGPEKYRTWKFFSTENR